MAVSLAFILAVAFFCLLGRASAAPPTNEKIVFDPTKCVEDSSVICFYADPTYLVQYLSPSALPTNYAQLMIRMYNPKKYLIETWSEGPSVALVLSVTEKGVTTDQTIFNCAPGADGKIEVTSTRHDGQVTLSKGISSADKLYCKIILNGEIRPQTGEKVKLITVSKEYTIKRATFTTIFEDRCDLDAIKGAPSSTVQSGFLTNDLSDDDLFLPTITCPPRYTLVYKKGKNDQVLTPAYNLTCKKETKQFELGNGSTIKIDRNNKIWAGCQRRECDMCPPQDTFPCHSDVKSECDKLKKEVAGDCTLFKCPQNVMYVNGAKKLSEGNITCTNMGESRYDWSFGGTAVNDFSCPTEIPCGIVPPLVCNGNCTDMLDGVGTKVVTCKDKKSMRTVTDGISTNVTNLVCSTATGIYEETLLDGREKDLPDGAKIYCDGDDKAIAGAGADPNALNGASTELIVGGSAAALFLIVAAVGLVVFCLRRRRRKADGLSKTKDTTTTGAMSTTNTRKSLETTPKATVPIAAPTPLVPTTTPWDLTERTPVPPTPVQETVAEQPTQDAPPRSHSSKSGPQEPPPPAHVSRFTLKEAMQIQEEVAAEKLAKKAERERIEAKMRKRFELFKKMEKAEQAAAADVESDVEARKSSEKPNDKKRRQGSRHRKNGPSSVHPTQNEESTKHTQKESKTKTKRTQNTQRTRTVDQAAPADEEGDETSPAQRKTPEKKAPPKKADYAALNQIEKDSFDSDESKRPPVSKEPIPMPVPDRANGEPAYQNLAALMDKKDAAKATKDKLMETLELVTQKTEDDKSLKKRL